MTRFNLPPLKAGFYSGPPGSLDMRATGNGKVVHRVVEPVDVDEDEDEEEPVDEFAKHKSSKKENYCTPASFLELVTELGPIGLDPCSNENSLVCAKTEYRFDRGQDGLILPWEGHGLVFCNPPYGRKTRAWLQRMAAMAACGVEIVGLVAARPDTIGFQDCGADLICCWRGRLIFLDGDTGKPVVDKDGRPTGAVFPSAVLYYGPQKKLFREIFTYDETRPKGQRGGKVIEWT